VFEYPDELGAWLVYPIAGAQAGTGGDCYAVSYFGDRELDALRYANKRDGYRAVYIKPGQTILEALEANRD
jgi:hypothetical protein